MRPLAVDTVRVSPTNDLSRSVSRIFWTYHLLSLGLIAKQVEWFTLLVVGTGAREGQRTDRTFEMVDLFDSAQYLDIWYRLDVLVSSSLCSLLWLE